MSARNDLTYPDPTEVVDNAISFAETQEAARTLKSLGRLQGHLETMANAAGACDAEALVLGSVVAGARFMDVQEMGREEVDLPPLDPRFIIEVGRWAADLFDEKCVVRPRRPGPRT